jgi:3-oxoacyl-[acyl-carrier-protein] synthase-3
MFDISTYLPSKVVTNSDLQLEFLGYNFERLGKKIGIEERRICEANETPLDLAIKACENLFEKVDKKVIDFVIYCTQSPEYYLPTTACILQDKLGLRKDCGAFDYNLGCSGYIYGLAMAKSFINSKLASNVLLVTAEAYSKHIHSKDITNRAIFGDGATATLIKTSNVNQIGEFNLGSDGSGVENLIVKGGGGKAGFQNSFKQEERLFMNGSEVFQFTLDNVPLSINDCLEKNELSKSEIDYFILHQANRYMLNNCLVQCRTFYKLIY